MALRLERLGLLVERLGVALDAPLGRRLRDGDLEGHLADLDDGKNRELFLEEDVGSLDGRPECRGALRLERLHLLVQRDDGALKLCLDAGYKAATLERFMHFLVRTCRSKMVKSMFLAKGMLCAPLSALVRDSISRADPRVKKVSAAGQQSWR